jgi:hypothetical protein
MKPFFSLLLVMATLSTNYTDAMAQTSITVYAENGQPFFLFLNNKQINDIPTNRVTASELILKDYSIALKWKDITQPDLEDVVKVKPNAVREFIVQPSKKGFVINEAGTSKKGQGITTVSASADESSKGSHSCPTPVSDAEFIALQEKLSRLDYPQDKVSLAKDKIINGCYTVKQLGILLSLLDYESDKSELAKFAYSYIYDRKNYSDLAGLFEYPGAFDEILRYLIQQPSYF